MVGYKDHKEYGDSSIYENSPSDQTKVFLGNSRIIYNTLDGFTEYAKS